MNLLKAWNAIAARAKNRPADLMRKRRTSRRALHEPLEVRQMLTTTLYWDGGSSGIWNASNTNWSPNSTGGSDQVWDSTAVAVFGGAPAAVSIDTGGVTANSIRFTTSGYTLSGDLLALSGANTIEVDTGLSETISAGLNCVDGMEKIGAGEIALSGTSTGNGNLTVVAGRFDVTGSLSNPVIIDAGATFGGGSGSGNGTGMTGPVTNNGGMYLANLYHVELVRGDNPNGSLSYVPDYGGWILGMSPSDAVNKLITGSYTSDEGITYNFYLGPGSPFRLGGTPDGIGNRPIYFTDPDGDGSGIQPQIILTIPGDFDLNITTSSLQDDPPCDCFDPVKTATGAGGGNPSFNGSSDGGLADTAGQFNLAMDSMVGSDFGTTFNYITRLNNQSAMSDANSDPNLTVSSMPHTFRLDVNTYALVAAGQVRYFDKIGGDYLEHDFYRDSFSRDDTHDKFVISDSAGDTFVFNSFSDSLPILERGQLYEIIDAGGNVAKVVGWNSHGQPTGVQLTSTDAGVTVTDTYSFAYEGGRNFNDPNAGQISSVTLSRQIDSSSFVVERTLFTYYSVSSTNSDPGQVEFALIQKPLGTDFQTIDRAYFRHDSFGNITYVFLNTSYSELLTAFGDEAGIEGRYDSDVAPYADIALTYSGGQISEVKSKGSGCSVCAGGLGRFDYTFETNFDAPYGYNTWAYKMVETLPDSSTPSTETVYANYAGEIMLTDKLSGSDHFVTAYHYDSMAASWKLTTRPRSPVRPHIRSTPRAQSRLRSIQRPD